MMTVFLFAIVGLIPVTLGLSLIKLYGKSHLTVLLFIYMFGVAMWQINHAVLFIDSKFMNVDEILNAYKFTRIGPIIGMPILLHISYYSLKDVKFNTFKKSSNIIFYLVNKYTLICTYIWSIFVYIINWTNYEITGLTSKYSEYFLVNYYFPTMGQLQFVYLSHIALYFIFTIIALIANNKVENTHMKKFMKNFFISSIILYLSGIVNLIPESSYLISTFAVIIYSLIIVFSFTELHIKTLENYHRVIEKQNKLDYVGNLTSSFIHEVKNSIAIIQGYSEVFPHVVKLDKTGQEILENIKLASTQLSSLTTNYNHFFKNSQMLFESSDLIKVLKQTLTLTEELSNKKGVKLQFTTNEQYLNAYINQSSLCQVFLNLIKNSIEAIPENNKNKFININLNNNQDIIIIDIKDSGIGIPKSRWQNIFYAFNTTKESGNGLGLVFCKKIILEHRGSIEIIDSSENGTHMQIKLPRFKYNDILN